MKRRHRWIVLGIAVAGIALCVKAVLSFAVGMRENALAGSARPFFQEHYQAMGDAYSEAFTAGFFLCFFITMAGLAVLSTRDRTPSAARRQAEARRRSGAASAA